MGHIYATSSGRVFPVRGGKKQRVSKAKSERRIARSVVVARRDEYIDEKYARPFDCGYIAVDDCEDFY